MFKYLLALLIISSANVFACEKCDSFVNNFDKNLKLMKTKLDSCTEKDLNEGTFSDLDIINYVGYANFVIGAKFIADAQTQKDHEALVEKAKNNLKKAIDKNALETTTMKSLDQTDRLLGKLYENYMRLKGIQAMEAIIKKNHP